MQMVIIIIALVLVGGGILLRGKMNVTKVPTPQEVLGESKPANTPGPTATPTSLPTSGTTPTPQPPSTDLLAFVYPNATIHEQTSTSLSLTSGDDPQNITDWYKQKIKDLAMSTRSFVQTKTNGNVNNVLAAAKNSQVVKVTITKNASDALTTISISR